MRAIWTLVAVVVGCVEMESASRTASRQTASSTGRSTTCAAATRPTSPTRRPRRTRPTARSSFGWRPPTRPSRKIIDTGRRPTPKADSPTSRLLPPRSGGATDGGRARAAGPPGLPHRALLLRRLPRHGLRRRVCAGVAALRDLPLLVPKLQVRRACPPVSRTRRFSLSLSVELNACLQDTAGCRRDRDLCRGRCPASKAARSSPAT